MRSGFGKLLLLLLLLASVCAAPELLARRKEKPAESPSIERKRAVHALNRLTFGARPGDLQQVTATGVDAWIDQQLHPEKISDSPVEARLAPFRTLRMSPRELVEEFPDNEMIKRVMDGKKSMPSDPARRAVFQVQIARLQDKKERKAEAASAAVAKPGQAAAAESKPAGADTTARTEAELAAAAAADSASTAAMSSMPSSKSGAAAGGIPSADASPVDEAEARKREDRLYADLKAQSLVDLPPAQRYKQILAMSADEQVAFADNLRGGKGQEFLEGLDPKQKEMLQAMNNPQALVADELIQAKLLRAIYSQRQLQEVMTDFWFNHFNVFINKGADRVLLTSYEQDVIRPHALGKFEDLLVATAKSPAMLFYLDNWLSVGPDSLQATGMSARPRRRPPPKAKKKNGGLNENYGRELLELHTLSVNGGYSQRDVTEVAKVFTGWTIEKPLEGGGFKFDPRMHQPGPKFVLDHRIKPGGEAEGREVLHRLATSPKTAQFISLKLAQRFVSDDPPPALVDRMAKTFEKKKGDIREVLSTLFHSPEFWDDSAYRAKVKTPLEYVASAVRATGAEVDDAMPLARQIAFMGMPLYAAQPPTGYSMKAETWVSSSSLLSRMNFAIAFTGGKIKGVHANAAQLAGDDSVDPASILSNIETVLLASDVSKQTHDSIVSQLAAPAKASGQTNQPAQGHAMQDQTPQDSLVKKQITSSLEKKPQQDTRPVLAPDASLMAGLLLGSPEFQRR